MGISPIKNSEVQFMESNVKPNLNTNTNYLKLSLDSLLIMKIIILDAIAL